MLPYVCAPAFVLVSVWSGAAFAVNASLGNITPRGGARGTEIEVNFHGGNLQDAVGLMFHEPGIELIEITHKEAGRAACRIRIAEDCRLGLHGIRVRTATGVSDVKLFSVSNLKEVSETEPNNESGQAQVLELNTVANGVVQNEDVDYYAVELAEGQRVAAEAEAIRLGRTLFDVKLRMFGPGGHELIAEDDTALMRQVAAFVHVAKETGTHLIAVSEPSYGGSGASDYRLHVGAFPRPLSVTPMGGQPGSEVTVTWLGDPGIAQQTLTLPEGDGRAEIFPSNESGVAPTPVPIRLASYAGVLEQEPNNSREEATAGAVPGAFDGVISEEHDVDFYAFDGKKGQAFRVQVFARTLGSPLDSVLRVFAPGGNQIAANDDSAGVDSVVDVTLPEDGRFVLAVRDHLNNGGETYAYRVEALPQPPGIRARIANNKKADITVPKGNHAFMLMKVDRTGFNEDLAFEWLDLPAGVRAEHAPIAKGRSDIPVVFHADPEAPVAGHMLGIQRTHQNEQRTLQGGFDLNVELVLGRNNVVFERYEMDRLAFAVGETAPFSLEIVPPKVPMVQSGNMRIKVVAKRAEGFNAPINLKVPYIPGGFGAGTATIAADQSEALLTIECRGNAPVGHTSFVVEGEGGGYRMCTPFTPLEVTPQWVGITMPEIQAEQGKDIELKVAMTKTRDFEGTHKVELLRLPKGLTTTPQDFTKDTTELVFPITVAADAPEGKHGPLAFRAVIVQNEEPINHGIQGALVKVYKPLPPQLQQPKPAPKPQQAKQEEKKPPKRRTRFPETTQ